MLFVFAGYLLIILLYIPDTNQVELFILLWIIRPISVECGFYRHIGNTHSSTIATRGPPC